MSTVSDVSGSGASAAAASLANAQTNSLVSDTQDRFLTLLVTQLQNQDPLNPMDNAQVTSQIAQLSTVNGIQQLNNTLLALSGQMDMSQSLQAASLIGKDILYPGGKISVGGSPDATTVTPFGYDLMSPAAKTVMTVRDASGATVYTQDLGPQDSGVYRLGWDGKTTGGTQAPDGAYTVSFSATDANEQPVSVQALTAGHVSSVAYAADGLKLNLAMGDKISLLDIGRSCNPPWAAPIRHPASRIHDLRTPEVKHGFRTRSQRFERRGAKSGRHRQQHRKLRHRGIQGGLGHICRRLCQFARGPGGAGGLGQPALHDRYGFVDGESVRHGDRWCQRPVRGHPAQRSHALHP
jgi:flagellar basal-body rod modification protein FlgD